MSTNRSESARKHTVRNPQAEENSFEDHSPHCVFHFKLLIKFELSAFIETLCIPSSKSLENLSIVHFQCVNVFCLYRSRNLKLLINLLLVVSNKCWVIYFWTGQIFRYCSRFMCFFVLLIFHHLHDLLFTCCRLNSSWLDSFWELLTLFSEIRLQCSMKV